MTHRFTSFCVVLSIPMTEKLFEPTIETSFRQKPFLSIRAMFLGSFFCGPVGAVYLGWLNASYLGVLEKRKKMILMCGLLAIAMMIALTILSYLTLDGHIVVSPSLQVEDRDLWRTVRSFGKIGTRIGGLLIWAMLHKTLRSAQDSAELADLTPRSPWRDVVLAGFLSTVAMLPYIIVLLYFR